MKIILIKSNLLGTARTVLGEIYFSNPEQDRQILRDWYSVIPDRDWRWFWNNDPRQARSLLLPNGCKLVTPWTLSKVQPKYSAALYGYSHDGSDLLECVASLRKFQRNWKRRSRRRLLKLEGR